MLTWSGPSSLSTLELPVLDVGLIALTLVLALVAILLVAALDAR
ncbi:hypothetical protein ACFFKU_17320 [Kineococcus gynurae]|uniref:Uncharacterized protein n=1 Tax=Kineococcus gynurae TaxID=452979 RepID=A0ABV5LP03_9ACTN